MARYCVLVMAFHRVMFKYSIVPSSGRQREVIVRYVSNVLIVFSLDNVCAQKKVDCVGKSKLNTISLTYYYYY